MKKKAKLIIVIVLILGLITSAGSFALWTWISNTANQNLVFNTAKNLQEYIIYDEGESNFTGDFDASSNYTGGIHSTIAINKTADAANAPLIATIHMDINQIGTYSKNSNALKWAVTEGDATNVGSLLASDTFRGLNSGDSIVLVPNLEVTTLSNNNPTKYTVWIWLDVNESPNPNLTGETLDTNVWTEINQLEGATSIFEISRISSDSQNITATVLSSKSNVVSYGVTTTTNSEPATWTDIASNLQGNIYNFSYNVSSIGTYYVWFKNAKGEVVSKQVQVSLIDESKPSCTFGAFSDNIIGVDDTATIELTCIDEQTRITPTTLTASDFTLSNANAIAIDSVSRVSIANGYKYTLTVTGVGDNQSTTITLPADKIANSVGLKNLAITSTSIMVTNDATAPTISVSVTNGTTYAKEKQATITLADNIMLTPGTYTIKYDWSVNTLNCADLTQTTTITVASGENTKSTNVTINSGDGAGKIYVCNIDSVSDPSNNMMPANTLASADMYLDNTGPTATLTITNNGSIVATLTNMADVGNGTTPSPYYYKISNDSTCNNNTTGFISDNNTSYAFTSGVTDAGTYYVCVKINDGLGNSSYLSDSIEIKAYLKTFTVATSDFKENDYRNKITRVEFVNNIDLTNAVSGKDPYNLDENNTGIIKGWLEQNDVTNNTYNLYIGSNTTIYSRNLTNVFYNMQNIEAINFNNYLNTSESTNMYGTFQYVGKTAPNFSLDLSGFDVGNVTDIRSAFSEMGYYAENFDVYFGNNFNMSSITNTYGMFSNVGRNTTNFSLNLGDNFNACNVQNAAKMFHSAGFNATNFSLNLGENFNSVNVTGMTSMFTSAGGNSSSFTIDLGNNFNTAKVIKMDYMFSGMAKNTTNNFSLNLGNNFDTSNVNTMSQMFWSIGTKATNFSLNLGNKFNTSNVVNMCQMFVSIGESETSDFSLNLDDKFDTSNVTDMAYMFQSLGKNATNFSLNLGNNFNTSKVEKMQNMFYQTGQSAINFNLNLGNNFNTSKVEMMHYMFYSTGRNAINFNLNLGNNFDTSNVSRMDNMFRMMGQNTSDFSFNLGDKFNTINVSRMEYMFNGVGLNATNFSLNLGDNFDTSNVTNMAEMFSYMGNNATDFTLNLGANFNTIKVQRMNSMFYHMAYNATDFDLDLGDKFDAGNVNTDMAWMFRDVGYKAINFSLNLGENFNASKATSMGMFFSGAGYNATNFNLNLGNNFNAGKVTSMEKMFAGTGYKATNFSLNLGNNFNTTSATGMGNMFNGTGYLSNNYSLDLGNNFNTSNVSDMQLMFGSAGRNAKSFTLNLGDNFNTANVKTMRTMFSYAGSNATNFTLNLGDKFDTSNVTHMGDMFSFAGSKATEFNLNLGNNFNTASVTIMSSMFRGVGENTNNFSLNLGDKFDMSSVTDTSYMFRSTANKTQIPFTLDLAAGNFSNVATFSYMFDSFPTSKATIYVKDADAQTWIIGKNSGFSATNVLIK